MKILLSIMSFLFFSITSYAGGMVEYPLFLPKTLWIVIILSLYFFYLKYKKCKTVCITSIGFTILTLLLIIIPCSLEIYLVEQKYEKRLNNINELYINNIENIKIIKGKIIDQENYDYLILDIPYQKGATMDTLSIKTPDNTLFKVEIVENVFKDGNASKLKYFYNKDVYLAYVVYENTNIAISISDTESFSKNEFENRVISDWNDDVENLKNEINSIKVLDDGSIKISSNANKTFDKLYIIRSARNNIPIIFSYIVLSWILEFILLLKDTFDAIKNKTTKKFKIIEFILLTIFKYMVLFILINTIVC